MLPLLQGLNSATHIAGDDPKTSQTLLLQSLDSLKKRLNGLELILVKGFFSQRSLTEGPELE
jgi:hypothetical protein